MGNVIEVDFSRDKRWRDAEADAFQQLEAMLPHIPEAERPTASTVVACVLVQLRRWCEERPRPRFTIVVPPSSTAAERERTMESVRNAFLEHDRATRDFVAALLAGVTQDLAARLRASERP